MSSDADPLTGNRDLIAVGALIAVTIVATAVEVVDVLRLPLAVLLLLVLPGYVTAAAAYAGRDPAPWTPVSLVERGALSLGGSLAILPLLAIVASLLPSGLARWPIVALASAYAFLGAVVTAVRRGRRSGETAGSTPGFGTDRSGSAASGAMFDRSTALTVVLAATVVVAVATLGAAVAAPPDGETTTDLHLLTEEDGRLVANGFPDELAAGESAALTVGVTNAEDRAVEYTVVTEVQRVQIDGRSINVVDKRGIDRRTVELVHGETWRERQTFEPSLTGANLRFVVHLYVGDPPATATAETAYRTTYVWFDVDPSGPSGDD